jgi:hypothetical protein
MDKLYNAGLGGDYGLTNQKFETEDAGRATFVSPLIESARLANELENRLRGLADRLCGSEPQVASNTASGGRPVTAPSGLLDEVSEAGRRTYDAIQEAHNSITRIERSLP